MSAPFYRLINDVFRGPVYGRHDIFTARSFDEFVRRNDVDLSRAIYAYDGRDPIGVIVFAQREHRAWLSLMGVLPPYRRRGYGRMLFGAAVDAVRASGATAIEFEVIQRNEHAARMYQSFGFRIVDELLVWARRERRGGELGAARRHSERAVTADAGGNAACWQREPRAVARLASSRIACDGAYAYVRVRDETTAVLLDAGARDVTSARALARMLDELRYDFTLLNEPAASPLSGVLPAFGWRVVERQHRMTD